MAAFRFERKFRFSADVGELWDALVRTEDYPRWWPWLREFDAPGLVTGETARVTVRAPIPIALRVSVHLEEVDPARLVVGRVSGDLDGSARLEIAPRSDGGSQARLVWQLDPGNPAFRTAARLFRPLLIWGQDWVVATGVQQFKRRALTG